MSAKTQQESPAEIKAQIEAVKAASQERTLSRKEGNAITKSLLTPLIPIAGEDTDLAYRTDVALEAAEKAAREEEERRARIEADTYLYYVRCRKSHRGGMPPHGVYLTRNPGTGAVAMNEWYSRYKTKEQVIYDRQVVCQVCLWQSGERNMLNVNIGNDGTFTVDDRWLWRRPKDEARAKIEGDTRANEVAAKSSNEGRMESMQRAKDAGFEVAL